jgi:hypothetical protein
VQRKRTPNGAPRKQKQTHQNVIRLVERRRDEDAIKHLEQLLQEAREGKIIGLLAAVHYGGSDYGYVGSGSMCHNPGVGITAAHRLATKLLHSNK